MDTHMVKSTIISAMLGVVTAGGVDAENLYIKVGSTLAVVASMVLVTWRIRGLFDKHNDQHKATDERMEELYQKVSRLPCRDDGRCEPSNGRSGPRIVSQQQTANGVGGCVEMNVKEK